MRLSIAIVFLIGAMVTTEVMCDATRDHAARVRVWFEEILKRLEDGQTLEQNREFLVRAFINANKVLEFLSHRSSIACPLISGDRLDPNEATILKIDKDISNQIVSIQEIIGNYDHSSKGDVSNVLEAIKDVLEGDVQSARAAIDRSKDSLRWMLTADERKFLSCTEVLVVNGRQDIKTPDLPPYYMGGQNGKTGAIREWLRMKLLDLGRYSLIASNNQNIYPDDVYKYRFMDCLAQTAQALVNPLPQLTVTSSEGSTLSISKTIGRYSPETHHKVYMHILRIQTHITSINNSGVGPLAAAVESVLKPILHIFGGNLQNAAQLLPHNQRDYDQDFNAYMDKTYKLYGPEIVVHVI